MGRKSAGYQDAILALFGLGWLLALLSTFLIDHFDLFGLRQVWLNFRRREYKPLEFKVVGFYRAPSHKCWVLSWRSGRAHDDRGHLLFAIATTGYIAIAVRIKEADLMRFYGESYRRYRASVRSLLPLP